MKRRNVLIWAAIVVVGLPTGYFARDYLNQPEDRAQAAMRLFEKYCVPLTDGQLVRPDSSLTRLNLTGELAWAEPEALILLRLADSGCSVSDMLQPLKPEERHSLGVGVVKLIERELPILTPDHNHGLDSWAEFKVWASHPIRDNRRWGITLYRVSSDEDSETALSLSYPKNDVVSKNLRELETSS